MEDIIEQTTTDVAALTTSDVTALTTSDVAALTTSDVTTESPVTEDIPGTQEEVVAFFKTCAALQARGSDLEDQVDALTRKVKKSLG